MSESAILTAARAIVAATLPGFRDWSDNPAAIKPDKLGAFHVTVTRNSAAPAAMGSRAEEVNLTVATDIFLEFGAHDDGRRIATERGQAILKAWRAAPDIARLVDFTIGTSLDVELAQAESRLARATVALSVLATIE